MLVLSIKWLILRAASNFPTAYVMNSFADLCFTTYLYYQYDILKLKSVLSQEIYDPMLTLLININQLLQTLKHITQSRNLWTVIKPKQTVPIKKSWSEALIFNMYLILKIITKSLLCMRYQNIKIRGRKIAKKKKLKLNIIEKSLF